MHKRESLNANRTFSRYSQRLSEVSPHHNTFDFHKEHDLLSQLSTYKAMNRTRHTSPNKSEFSYSASPQKREIRSSFEYKSDSQYRATTAPYNYSILRAARLVEMTPPDHNVSKNSSQDKSNERLYRGARVQLRTNSKERDSPLFKLADVVSDSKETEFETELILKEKKECSQFVDSLNFMKDLRFDLELNFDIVRGKDENNDTKMLGNYFNLEEKLKNYDSLSIKNMKKYKDEDFVMMLRDYNRILRDTLRALKGKNADDEAIMVEML